LFLTELCLGRPALREFSSPVPPPLSPPPRRDWILIYLSHAIYKNPISRLNLFGYSIAFCAVGVYNQMKIRQQMERSRGGGAPGGPVPAPGDKREGETKSGA
jgi:hypothetical protein